MDAKNKDAVEVTVPVIIDLGKQRGKLVKRLKRGKGRLMGGTGRPGTTGR